MMVRAGGNGFGGPATERNGSDIGMSAAVAAVAFSSMRGVNGGESTPLWKKSPWPASAS